LKKRKNVFKQQEGYEVAITAKAERKQPAGKERRNRAPTAKFSLSSIFFFSA